MAVSKKFRWTNANSETIEVEFGADGGNVTVDDRPLTDVLGNTFQYKGNASNKSLDEYVNDKDYGMWRIGSGFEPTDMPLGRIANENVLLLVIKAIANDTAYCKQVLIYTSQHITLERTYGGADWSAWIQSVVTVPGTKSDGKFTAFSNGALVETDYSHEQFLRSDAINEMGKFERLTIAHPSASPEDAVNEFTSGAYYDARSFSAGAWIPSASVTGQGGTLVLENGTADTGKTIGVPINGEVMLPKIFNDVTYYDGSGNEFKFRIAFIANITGDMVIRDLISLFNGNLSVQRRGAYGIRTVAKYGVNGTSLVTSDFIIKDGLLAIAIEGSNASGDLILTVQPLNTDFTVKEEMSTVTINLPQPVYIGTTKIASFVIDATEAETDIYSIYTEHGTALASVATKDIISDMCSMFTPEQDETASVIYVNRKLSGLGNIRSENGEIMTSSAEITLSSRPEVGMYYFIPAQAGGAWDTISWGNAGANEYATLPEKLQVDLGQSAIIKYNGGAGDSGAGAFDLVATFHEHDNKSILDGITTEKVQSWDDTANNFNLFYNSSETPKYISLSEIEEGIDSRANAGTLSGADVLTLAPGIYQIKNDCANLPDDIGSPSCGMTLIITPKASYYGSGEHYNIHLIANYVNDGSSDNDHTKIWSCQIFVYNGSSSFDMPWTLIYDSIMSYKDTPVQIATWVDGTPVWKCATDILSSHDGVCRFNLHTKTVTNNFKVLEIKLRATTSNPNPNTDADISSLVEFKDDYKYNMYGRIEYPLSDGEQKIYGYCVFITPADNIS